MIQECCCQLLLKMFTVNYVEQSSLKMLTARRVHHLQISFTKTIYSSNSEEVQLWTMGPVPIFDLDGLDTTLIRSPTILSPLNCWGLWLSIRWEELWIWHDGSQVGNNADDWCDSIVKDGTYVDHSFIERPSPLIVWHAGPMCHARLCLNNYGVDIAWLQTEIGRGHLVRLRSGPGQVLCRSGSVYRSNLIR